MSCLIHPTGWRLYSSRFWKSNFYVKRRYLNFFNLNNKVIYEIVNSILQETNFLTEKNKNFLKLGNFKLIMNRKIIYLLIHYKIYWNTIYKLISIAQYKTMGHLLLDPNQNILDNPFGSTSTYNRRKRFRGRKLSNKKLKRRKPLRKKVKSKEKFANKKLYNFLIKERFLLFSKNEENPKETVLTPNPLRIFESKHYSIIYKKLMITVFFFPLFVQLKKYLFKAIKTRLPSYYNLEVYFLAKSWQNFNPIDVLKLTEYLIISRGFTPIKTLYTILRIMLNYKEKYNLRGFKFLLAGRFSRRDRATYLWKTDGGVNLSSKLATVDFYSLPIQGKYSKCITKLWVAYA